MNLESILNELRSYRTRIDQAIASLQGTARGNRLAKDDAIKRRHMSAAARARISAARKTWWTKQKRKTSRTKSKPTPITTAKPMSPAA